MINQNKYLKTYFWQGLALVARLFSFFIVTPYLSKNPAVFGIYSICISITLLLNYADLGFMRASQKYAAEFFANGNCKDEVAFIGFGSFILLVLTLVCSIAFSVISMDPSLLINGLDSTEKFNVASNLLFVMALFAPAAVLQRTVMAIFDIRLEGFVPQRVLLLSSIISLCFVPIFFGDGSYQIVNYFVFLQCINAIAICFCLFLASRLYGYPLKGLFYSVRFTKNIYARTKAMAYSGLFVMLAWIVYYESDPIFIGKFLDSESVAIYSVAFVIAGLFRMIYGVYFSPFMVRANHIIGSGSDNELRKFFLRLLLVSTPFVVLPTVAFALVAKSFILSWVGNAFYKSIDLAICFSLMFTLSFSSYISSILLVAKERVREMYMISIFQTVFFWVGVISTYKSLGLISFAIFKLVTAVISEFYYFYILSKYLQVPAIELSLRILRPLVPSLFVLIIIVLTLRNFLPDEVSKYSLMLTFFVLAISLLVSLIVVVWLNQEVKKLGINLIRKFINHKVC